MPAVPPSGLVVVTGATGYIGSHTCLAALKAGLRVRGTVQSLERAHDLPAALKKQGADVSKLELVVIDDLTSQDQYEKAFQGADGVAHVALPRASGDAAQAYIAANVAMLRAATKESSIKRIVLTSSSAAAISPPAYKDGALTGEDWNDAAITKWSNASEEDKQRILRENWLLMYGSGKTLAEKEAWKFIHEQKPSFDLVSILPNANYGPTIFGGPRSTAEWIYGIFQGDVTILKSVTRQWFIDVRDDARLHVLALTTPSVSNIRIWAVAEPWGWNKIFAILRKHFPNVKIPEDITDESGDDDPQKIDNKIATELIGSWISLEQSLVDMGKAFGS